MRIAGAVSRWLLLVVSLVSWPLGFVNAQAPGADPSPGGLDAVCLAFGAITSVAVTLLKGIPFIARNPKWVALICSIVVAGGQAWYHGAMPSVATITACVLTQLSGAVATHEVVVKPVQATFAGPLG